MTVPQSVERHDPGRTRDGLPLVVGTGHWGSTVIVEGLTLLVFTESCNGLQGRPILTGTNSRHTFRLGSILFGVGFGSEYGVYTSVSRPSPT